MVGDGGGVGLLAGVGPEGDCCMDDITECDVLIPQSLVTKKNSEQSFVRLGIPL